MPSVVERKELQQLPVVREVSLLCQVAGLPQLCVDNVVSMWGEHWKEIFILAEELKTGFLH